MSKRHTYPILLLSTFLFFSSPSFAQSDSTGASYSSDTSYTGPKEFVFKPTIGLGTGMFTFYGDVANSHKGFHPLVSRVGFHLRVSHPLTDWLDLGFYVIFGKISANERSVDRNLNFESSIRTGGAVLSYNFKHLLPEKHKVEPFLFAGFESFEFLSKTDLYDRYGNYYHYWSDGSIRNIDQNAPNANEAVVIYRDYVYESDLREQNLDGLGKYRERSWSIPIGGGVQFLVGERMKFRIGTSYHLAFTDLVDNVSSAGSDERKGDSKNDRFLYTSVSLNWDLKPFATGGKKPKITVEPDDNDDYYVRDETDLDKDGVRDFDDECLNTPAGLEVDERGCPVDKDKDLVFDYLDDELPTPKGNFVDGRGVTLTDEDIYQRYLRFKDSTGEYNKAEMDYEEVRFNGAPAKPHTEENLFENKTYFVLMGAEKRAISANELYKYLSFKDFKTIESGDTIFYVIGNYKSIQEAIAKQEELEKNGYDPKGIAIGTKPKNNNESPVKTLTEDQVKEIAKNETPLQNGHNNQQGTKNSPPPAGTSVYRVQIGAYKKRLNSDVFKDVPDVVYFTGDDGVTRYYSGYFTSPEEAAHHQIDLFEKGYTHAFLTAFKDGQRVSLEEAGAHLAEKEEGIQERPNSNNELDKNRVNPELVRFKVSLGTYKGDIPASTLDLFLELGDVLPRGDESGGTMYTSGEFKSYAEAEKYLKEMQQKGVLNALIIGEFNGHLISVSEARALLGE